MLHQERGTELTAPGRVPLSLSLDLLARLGIRDAQLQGQYLRVYFFALSSFSINPRSSALFVP